MSFVGAVITLVLNINNNINAVTAQRFAEAKQIDKKTWQEILNLFVKPFLTLFQNNNNNNRFKVNFGKNSNSLTNLNQVI